VVGRATVTRKVAGLTLVSGDVRICSLLTRSLGLRGYPGRGPGRDSNRKDPRIVTKKTHKIMSLPLPQQISPIKSRLTANRRENPISQFWLQTNGKTLYTLYPFNRKRRRIRRREYIIPATSGSLGLTYEQESVEPMCLTPGTTVG
jgi:hypothetical protein